MPVPESIPTDTYAGINLDLWIISIILHYICAVLLIMKARSTREVISLRRLLFSYAWFVISLGLNRIFFTWAYLAPTPEEYSLYLGLGYLFATLALLPVYIVLEKYYVTTTKNIFTVVAVILTALSLISVFLPENLYAVRTTLQLMGMGASVLWFFLYIWIIKQTTGAPRQKAIKLLLSVFIAILGFTLDSEMILVLQIIPPYVAPIVYSFGFCLMTYVLIRD